MAQQNAQPRSFEVIFPTAPAHESEDSRERINVMIDIFNETLRSSGRADRGLYHEIRAAMHITHQCKHTELTISRPLTEAEKRRGLNGNSQMILVPLGNGKHRELDMVCEAGGITYIVEAKNTKTGDQHQLRANVLVARQKGWGVMYVLRDNKTGQAQALRDTFQKIPEAQQLTPLRIETIKDKLEAVFQDGAPQEMTHIVTNRDIFEKDYWEGTLGRRVSYSEAWELSRKEKQT
ncbi:hypothetical protein CKAH01_14536 [Colletotrichum kahawae]|uniref:Uncharacterized protein n=1 Tax=Colletotrichum kahawae TaxID=34407 RepID=A0AAD9YMP6_COLKA|nr:hypothetical protein CKAH01_14536 [Colletotrichum kahawae]